MDKLDLVVKNPDIVNNVDDNANRLSYFIQNPTYTAGIILRTISDVISSIIDSLQNPRPYFINSQTMGIINLFVITFAFLISFLLFKTKVPKAIKIVLGGIIACITLAVFYAISGDVRVFKLGDLAIAGVQGRYHYYLLVALPLLFSEKIRAKYESLNLSLESFDREKATILLMKMMVLLNFMNTAIAVFGYL